MMRRAYCVLLLLASAAFSLPATAQTFSVNAVEIRKNDGKLLTENEVKRTYFNRAKCECALPMRVTLRITPNTTGSDQDRIYVVVGTGTCINTNDNSLSEACTTLYTEFVYNIRKDVDVAISEGDDVSRVPTVADLMLNSCTENRDVNLYVFKGLENNLTPITPTAVTLSVDGQLPAPPTSDKDPEPGEGIVSLRFTSGSDTEPNARYQILCERADTGEPGLSNPPGAGYETAVGVCSGVAAADGGVADGSIDAGVSDATVDTMVDAAPQADGAAMDLLATDSASLDATAADGGVDTSATVDLGGDASASEGITSLDPRYVCSEASPSDGIITVKGLANDVNYRFYVVAIDEHQNPSAPIYLGEATPVLAEDLWERYKRANGEATGGFCAVGGEGQLGSLLLLSLLALSLVARRRARR